MALFLERIRFENRCLFCKVQKYFCRQLCALLGSGSIYRCLSVLLLKENDSEFISQMVALLHGILLTSSELFELRKQLRTLESNASLFPVIYLPCRLM